MTAPLNVAQYAAQVRQRAGAYGLDPAAVLAISSQEGISGRIGDSGHAFGPFQLNDAGGSFPASLMYLSQAQKNAWAWSTDGIEYALQQMGGVARGLSGYAAIHAIATFFERPRADLLPGEIAGAWAQYSSWTDGIPVPNTGPVPGGVTTVPIPGITTDTPVQGNAIVEPSSGADTKLGSIGPFAVNVPSGLILGLLGAFLLILGAILFAFNVKVQQPTINVSTPQVGS